MKKIMLVFIAGSLFCFLSCATGSPPASETSLEKPVELSAAITQIAKYFAENIPQGAKLAVTGIEADRPGLSDYIAEEFQHRLQESRRFTMIGRETHDTVMRELFFQNSGEVSADSRKKIGEALGPDTIVYGQLRTADGASRLVMYATEVESGKSLLRPAIVILPPQWSGPPSAADKIDRAVAEIGRKLYMQTPVIMGSVSLSGTTASTSLSDYLRPRLTGAMQKRGSLFRVLDEKNAGPQAEAQLVSQARAARASGGSAAAPARLSGEFPARSEGEDVPVTLSLTALENGELLGSAEFTISGKEMAEARLSALPPNTTREKFEAKKKALAEYSGKNNAFVLRVMPDQAIYHEGDFLSFSIYSEADCYFQIVSYDAEDNVGLMFPANARDWEKNRIRAGETRRIPDTPRYLLGPPFGQEYIIVMAYRDQIQVKAERPGPVSPQAILMQLNLKGFVDLENPDNTGKPVKNVPPAATTYFSYTILQKR